MSLIDTDGPSSSSSTTAAPATGTGGGDEYTTTLFLARECFVYRVPPRASAAGYKAAEWGDMEAFLWKGRLRILEIGEKRCEIRLEDASSGELFALCPYDVSGASVEPVLDSSRYFVLRVESDAPGGAGKRKAYIGMGFQDRSDSFDFNVSLQDWTKRQRSLSSSSSSSSSTTSSSTTPSPHLPPPGEKKDFSLKEGEVISVKIPGRSAAGGGGSAGGALRKIGGAGAGGGFGGLGGGGGGGGGGPLLPPPPSKRR